MVGGMLLAVTVGGLGVSVRVGTLGCESFFSVGVPPNITTDVAVGVVATVEKDTNVEVGVRVGVNV
jgi:hypothetical protein